MARFISPDGEVLEVPGSVGHRALLALGYQRDPADEEAEREAAAAAAEPAALEAAAKKAAPRKASAKSTEKAAPQQSDG